MPCWQCSLTISLAKAMLAWIQCSWTWSFNSSLCSANGVGEVGWLLALWYWWNPWLQAICMWPELSSVSSDLQKISQCFPVILPVLQKNTHVLRVNSIASWYQWIYCVLGSEKSLFLTPTNYFQSTWQSLQFTPLRYERFTLCCALSSWKMFPEPGNVFSRQLPNPLLCFRTNHVREQSFR